MNFFARQEQARRSTRRLVLIFVLTVIAVIVAVDAVVAGLMLFGADPATPVTASELAVPLLLTSVVVLAIISIASLFRMASLGQGGGAVARALGGSFVPPDSQDPKLRRLRNVVEEMAIASGVSVPEIYVLDEEPGINAFAAGLNTSDAAVAVTRGALDRLNRDELQGVMAHEFSHILNGDMRLNMRLLGMLFGILSIGLLGRMLLRSLRHVRVSRSRNGGNAAIAILALGVALTIIGYVGVLGAKIIKAAVSRQREYLADASAVQFTRQPDGIAGALKKIGGFTEGSQFVAHEPEEVSHMLFANGFRSRLSSMFATHPPLDERIRAIDPSFRPSDYAKAALAGDGTGDAMEAAAGFAQTQARRPQEILGVSPSTIVAEAGNPDQAQIADAMQLRASIPPIVDQAAHDSGRAAALFLALLLNDDETARARQFALIGEQLNPLVAESIRPLYDEVSALGPAYRLPLADILFSALRHQPRKMLEQTLALSEDLIMVDGQVAVFEYALVRLMRQHLTEVDKPLGEPRGVKLIDSGEALQTLFSVMARTGHADEREARAAFETGLSRLLPTERPDYTPPERWTKPWDEMLDRALTRLDGLPFVIKEGLIEALTITVLHDGRITLRESELLRTVCALLHCPLPPLYSGQATA
ncbi:MAG: M48 family metallopeptidase [Ectothiorhodospiraceae bacterium]|nr:M48 family metallopeptidase [Ectothiorhodospiraceae bacterium]